MKHNQHYQPISDNLFFCCCLFEIQMYRLNKIIQFSWNFLFLAFSSKTPYQLKKNKVPLNIDLKSNKFCIFKFLPLVASNCACILLKVSISYLTFNKNEVENFNVLQKQALFCGRLAS